MLFLKCDLFIKALVAMFYTGGDAIAWLCTSGDLCHPLDWPNVFLIQHCLWIRG